MKRNDYLTHQGKNINACRMWKYKGRYHFDDLYCREQYNIKTDTIIIPYLCEVVGGNVALYKDQ